VIIYLDESGDLGFDFTKRKTSRKFVITLLVSDDRETATQFKKAVRRTLKNKVNHKKKRKIVREMKGTQTRHEVKEYFFRNMPTTGWRIYSVVLNKERVYPKLKTKQGKKKLYNFLARFILEKVDLRNHGTAVNLIIDRCKNREEIRDFNNYIANQLEGLLPLNVPLYITHELSQDNTGLQVVDLFCWGLYRKYESNDTKWYDVFKEAIGFEDEYLK
jgi:hypothetical protein